MADFLTHTLGASERIFHGNTIADWLVAGILGLAVITGRILTGFLLDRWFAPRVAAMVRSHEEGPPR